jgi:hypothetical protein
VEDREGGESGLKYDIMKGELNYTFYKFTSWTKCPLRGSMHGQNQMCPSTSVRQGALPCSSGRASTLGEGVPPSVASHRVPAILR